MNIKLAVYTASAKTPAKVVVLVPRDMAGQIGRLQLAKIQTDERTVEITLRRSMSGNDAVSAPNRADWCQYNFSGRVLKEAMKDDAFAVRMSSALTFPDGNELKLLVDRSDNYNALGHRPLEEVFA
jgi:hypothetical protein